MLRWLCTMWSLLSCQITHSCSTVISDAPENVKTRCTETPSLFLSSVVHPPSCASNVRCRLNRLSAQIHDELSCSTGVTRRVLQPVLQLAGICELTTPCCDDIKGCGLFICDSVRKEAETILRYFVRKPTNTYVFFMYCMLWSLTSTECSFDICSFDRPDRKSSSGGISY
eukprot:GHVS01056184.1.p1 GENE.GHVS01056184.1~~GHVS01056184.1.p1  ORF type:complete len:170 (+),score=12.96 GHVS01056184.1:841-1350(+)